MERVVVVQLSDIHVGSVGNGFYAANSLWAGLHGHHPLLMEQLAVALGDVRDDLQMEDDEPLNVVVSGDLTCTGLDTDFAQAYTYLLGELRAYPPANPPVGLKIPRDRLWAVPGNHDHWDGRHAWPQPAYDHSVFPDWLQRTPWRAVLESSGKAVRLELFGVDSNTDLARLPYNDTAWGAFSWNELYHPVYGLEANLQESVHEQMRPGQAGTHVVRAVVCHHAFSNKGQSPPGTAPPTAGMLARRRFRAWWIGKNPDPLTSHSVSILKQLCFRYGVIVVMTGHTHYFSEERDPLSVTSGPYVWELRCSTTLQGPPATGVQGFYVHEVGLGGGPTPVPVWRYKRYQFLIDHFEPQSTWAIAD